MLHLPKHPYLFAWLCWLVLSCLLVLGCLPKIRDAFKRSGVRELLASRSVEQVASDHRQVTVFFLDSSLKEVGFQQWQKRLGGDQYHDTLENLLAGPDLASIRKGAASFIAPDTELIGCTLSSRTLFVDLSRQFLGSPDLGKAVEQIETTMRAFDAVDRVQILVDGQPLSELRQK
ncbi:MAG: GerMN domain-containing protein [Sphaerochaetaceae bacterium]|nr:GerMN domain-containing protein [Spirochaetales bacterium]MDY5500887.1 GerMN domain-containing protein [Sphaerochaetaceae bacterium]